ncbi:MAG: hypothetical protein IH910_09785 [Proteobacteria bacterium]|nr:hypothetical protein [Pseudomonadota bacterium]
MTADKDRLFKKLEHVGEHVVRENLENGVYGPNRRGLVEEWLEQFEDNDEAELLLDEEHEDEAGALASEARKVADESPPKKWYQRLLKKRGKDDPS